MYMTNLLLYERDDGATGDRGRCARRRRCHREALRLLERGSDHRDLLKLVRSRRYFDDVEQ